jgi:hypothetical protein
MHEDASAKPLEALPATEKAKRPFLLIFLKAVGVGVGAILMLALIAGGVVWYSSRPKLPKEWNTAAITAEYSYADTYDNENHLQFCYVLQNNTAYDYNLTSDLVTHRGLKLARENGFSEFPDAISGVYPAFIPAKQRGRFCLHLAYAASVVEPPHPTDDQRKAFRKEVENYMSSQLTNLDGFELFDTTNRYQILLPAGWRSKSNSK